MAQVVKLVGQRGETEAQRWGDTRERWNGGERRRDRRRHGERHGARDRESRPQRPRGMEEKQRDGPGRWRWSERRGVVAPTARSAGPERAVWVLPGGPQPDTPDQAGSASSAWGRGSQGSAPGRGTQEWSRRGQPPPPHVGHSIPTLAGVGGALRLSLPISVSRVPITGPGHPQVAFTVLSTRSLLS